MLIVRPAERFLERPFIEDAYYSISVARSIAQGNGFTIDGEQPTNGVQPLVCLLYSPFFLIFDSDPVSPLRGILALNILTGLIGALLFSRLLVRLRSSENSLPDSLVFWFAFAAWLVNYSLTTHLFNGLETGLTLVMFLLVLTYWIEREGAWTEGRGRMREALVLGLLIGLSVLVRIDAAIVGIGLAFTFFFGRLRRSGQISVYDISLIAVIGSVAVAISSPWWIYNLVEFGNLLPVSGQSQANLAPDRWSVVTATVSTMTDALVPGLHTPAGWTLGGVFVTGLVVPLLLFLAALLSRRVRNLLGDTFSLWRQSWRLERSLFLGLVVGLLVIAYTFFFSAPHFQPRYLVLLQVVGTILFVTLTLSFHSLVLSHKPSMRVGSEISVFLILVLSLILMSRHFTGNYVNIMLEPVAWIDENTSPGERIGMFQSGTAGYFFPDRVVNLDGKVNPVAHRKFEAGELGSYVDEMEFTYIIDWTLYTDRIFVDSPSKSSYRPIDTLDHSQMIVWKRLDRETSSRGNP